MSELQELDVLLWRVAAGVEAPARDLEELPEAIRHEIGYRMHRIRCMRVVRDKRGPFTGNSGKPLPNPERRARIVIARRGPITLYRSLDGYQIQAVGPGLGSGTVHRGPQRFSAPGRMISAADARKLQGVRHGVVRGREVEEGVFYRPDVQRWRVGPEECFSWQHVRRAQREHERKLRRSVARRAKDGALYGWRGWMLKDDLLVSPSMKTVWESPSLTAPSWTDSKGVRGEIGIHALSRAHMLANSYHVPNVPGVVIGRVRAYGRYVLGQDGWRAERAVVDTLLLVAKTAKQRKHMRKLARKLADRYQCNVRILRPKEVAWTSAAS